MELVSSNEIAAISVLVVLLLSSSKLRRFWGHSRPSPATPEAVPRSAGGSFPDARLVRCLSCRKPFSIPVPPTSNVGRCPHCDKRFTIVFWDSKENLYISPLEEKNEKACVLDSDDCADSIGCHLRMLGMDPRINPGDISPREVRKAYYKTIRQYHPDRYSELPAEFRTVAETKTRQLNEAYHELMGYLVPRKAGGH